MRKAFVLLVVFSAVLLLTSCGKNIKKYAIEETYKISLIPNEKAYLTVFLPKSYGYQSIENTTVAGFDRYAIEDTTDFSILSGEVKGDAPTKDIRISYDVSLTQGRLQWENEPIKKSIEPEPYIDSDDVLIQKTAASLKAESDDYKTAQNTAHYVSTHIKFDRSEKINPRMLSASEVLTLGKGVCADYANLTTTLLRANGIPARSISGLVFNKLSKASDWSHPGSSHAWVEFYANNAWHFADPTWGDRYFDAADGFHLSYGVSSMESELYSQCLDAYKNHQYAIIGAMSAPLKFIAASTDSKGAIVPMATVRKK